MVTQYLNLLRDFLVGLLDRGWTRSPRLALGLIVGGCLTTVFIGLTGPSTVVLTLGPRRSLLPPWYLPVGMIALPDWVLMPALWAAIVAGGVGLWIALRAIRAGWRPRHRRLFALAAGLNILTALVPPMTSGDVLMYAAYGRVQVLGADPYTVTPAEIFRQQYDAVLRFTERPWQDTPSVYGPIASFVQYAANVLGGDNMHDIVFWLQAFTVVSFLALGAITVRLAHGEPATQARAVFLTVGNPLLIWAIVAGGHNESLAVVFAVAGLYFLRRNPVLAGVGIGLAGCVKVTLVFYGIAMLWAYRRNLKQLALLLAGALVPFAICYGLLAPEALFAALRNTGYVSSGSWAAWVLGWLWAPLGGDVARVVVTVMSGVLLVLVAIALYQILPWTGVVGIDPLADPRRDPLTVAVRSALVLSAAWLLTAPYTLPWYDLIVWVPLAIMAPSALVGVFIWRGAALSVAYVASRSVDVDTGVLSVANYLRDAVSPTIQMWILAFLGLWWLIERPDRLRRRRTQERIERVRGPKTPVS
ncbi:hypothetical protein [Propionicicella superfundia]|uniref:hypothetical protein n=1 Tax=Propionicicella superfundia TaxID=348582 RepID=UPI0004278199|nr:hypothetical protein [Propionicicella superfundia]